MKNLERKLAVLTKQYRFVSMDKAVAMLTGEMPLLPFSAVLTFDDGYRNNITHAVPILQRYGVPAAFFLATGHVERREPFWYDRLDYAIQHIRKDQFISFAGQNFRFKPNQEAVTRTTFAALCNKIKVTWLPYIQTMREVNSIANSLEDNAGCRLSDIFEKDHYTAIMSWDEIQCAADQGITIGTHTVDHVLLDRLDERTAREQIVLSKTTIEQHTGRPCLYFCYPNGNWNNKIVSLVRETGVVAAVTTGKGANKIGDELLTLHRISFPEV